MVVPLPSYSDIAKILEQIPIWKAVTGLPKRVAELERKVAALEAVGSGKSVVPSGKECPICGATMTVVRETPHPHFDFAGRKVHHMLCAHCGQEVTRDFEPGKGYQ